MTIKTSILIIFIFLVGCSAETKKSDIQRSHNLVNQVNGSVKLMEAEQELISDAPYSFYAYQNLRHDARSYLVSNLKQSGEARNYLIGDGFFLIDKDYVHRSSRAELVKTLIKITQNSDEKQRYSNG